ALEHGEIPHRIGMLTAWRDSDYFTQAEEAALEIAEIITLIGESGYKDEQYARLAEILSEEQIAAATWIAIVINASNRLWIANNPPVRLPKELRRGGPSRAPNQPGRRNGSGNFAVRSSPEDRRRSRRVIHGATSLTNHWPFSRQRSTALAFGAGSSVRQCG